MSQDPKKWYFKTSAFIAAFLCIGPFALPLVWINPRFNTTKKIVITVITIVVSFAIGLVLAKSIENIFSYYQQILKLSQGG